MDAAAFADSPFGSPTREPGNQHAFTYYLPKPLPRSLKLSAQVVALLSKADAALGQLNGLCTLISDPQVLIGPALWREAVASSRIEGTQASVSDVLVAEALQESDLAPVNEVRRYLEATNLAYKLSASLPITQRMLLQVHEVLLRGVRGSERNPGELRRSPVWVGRPGDTPATAAYVPPLPKHLPDLLTDWERFVNDDGRELPTLVQAALMHYQFETIHPFLDGNGRIGRLSINLLLLSRGRLTHPLLHLSYYFETHRPDYYAALQGVRERGDIETWLTLFMKAVKAQADDSVARALKLVHLREEYRQAAAQTRSNLGALVELLMTNPYVTTGRLAEAAGMTTAGASNVIKDAERRGWLTLLGTRGQGGKRFWVAQAVLEAMEGDAVGPHGSSR